MIKGLEMKDPNEQKYTSFLSNYDAKNFKMQIQNYNELNFYDYKS